MRKPRTLENLNALIADTQADIDALQPIPFMSALSKIQPDDTTARVNALQEETTRENRAILERNAARGQERDDELQRLRRRLDRLWRERRKLNSEREAPGDWE